MGPQPFRLVGSVFKQRHGANLCTVPMLFNNIQNAFGNYAEFKNGQGLRIPTQAGH